jgi:hypothetical protein
VRLAYARRTAQRMIANGALASRPGSGQNELTPETLRQVKQIISSGLHT